MYPRCKTCPFVSDMVKISWPNRPTKITDHFTCISVKIYVIRCITCTLCKKIYIYRRNMEKIGGALSRKRTRCNLLNYYHHNMIICTSPGKKDSLLPHSADSAKYLILQWYKNKMAARTSKRSKERQVPYKVLNDLSSVDLLYEEKSKRKRT